MSLEDVLHASPAEGVETDWLPLSSFVLSDGRLALADPMFMHQAEAIPLPAGEHVASVKLRGFRGGRVVARLRIARAPGGTPGAPIATVVVESDQLGLGDLALIAPAIAELDEDAYEARLAETAVDAVVGRMSWNDQAPMLLIAAGLGEGRYTARELLADSQRIGVQIDLID